MKFIGKYGVPNTRSISPEQEVAKAELMNGLAEDVRIAIVNLLSRNPKGVCVQDIATALGIAQPTATHHLKLLLQQKIVIFSPDGTFNYYRLRKGIRTRLHETIDSIFGLPKQSKLELLQRRLRDVRVMLEDQEIKNALLGEPENVDLLLALHEQIENIITRP